MLTIGSDTHSEWFGLLLGVLLLCVAVRELATGKATYKYVSLDRRVRFPFGSMFHSS